MRPSQDQIVSTPDIITAKDLPKGFCVMPFLGMYVSTEGAVSPCCEFDGGLAQLPDAKLNETWESPEWEAVREKFRQGEKVEACWKCFDRDANEGESYRTAINGHLAHEMSQTTGPDPVWATTESPAYLDMRFSNLCNLKCRSCWHGSSSKWFTDAKALNALAGPKAEIKSFPTPDAAREAFTPLLDGVKHLYFAGGEPLIMPEHYKLLNSLIEKGRTGIRLSYNSNFMITSLGKQSIFDLWNQFPDLTVCVSVDAVGERGALIRSGFNWETFVENVALLRQRCPHVKVEFGITVSALNMLSLAELFGELTTHCGARPEDFVVHSLQEAKYYRSQILPRALKRQASALLASYMAELQTPSPDARAVMQAKISGITRYMWAENNSRFLGKFQRQTERVDALRQEKTITVLPELKAALTPTFLRRVSNFLRKKSKTNK